MSPRPAARRSASMSRAASSASARWARRCSSSPPSGCTIARYGPLLRSLVRADQVLLALLPLAERDADRARERDVERDPQLDRSCRATCRARARGRSRLRAVPRRRPACGHPRRRRAPRRSAPTRSTRARARRAGSCDSSSTIAGQPVCTDSAVHELPLGRVAQRRTARTPPGGARSAGRAHRTALPRRSRLVDQQLSDRAPHSASQRLPATHSKSRIRARLPEPPGVDLTGDRQR